MRSFALTLSTVLAGAVASIPPSSGSDVLQNILENTDRSEKYSYPTDFTRDLLPVGSSNPNPTLFKAYA